MKRILPVLSQFQCRNSSVPTTVGFSRQLQDSTRSLNTFVSPSKTNQTAVVNDSKFRKIASTVRTMASEKPANMIVEHDPPGKKFFIRLGKEEAKLEYTKRGDTLNMWHTEVPPALQGQGIAKVLAQGAFDHAVKNNLKMVLTCPYLQKFYAENPKDEYKKLVVGKE